MISAIYARKSTDQTGIADDQKSVARQIEHAKAYAVKKGWTVTDELVFVDDGVSGAEFASRPGFLRLMNSLKPRPPFQVLVMSEESRLGREQIETSYALKQLIQAGIRVFFFMEDRERTLDSPTDKILMSLTAFADELEREKARQRTKDAMVRKAKSGHVTGGQCFGYTNVEVLGPDGQRSHVERRINEIEASVVREIFELCSKGYGKTRIAKMLNDRGAPSPRPKQGRPIAWAPSSVRAVLFRDLYRGVQVWNKSKKRDQWGQQRQKPRPEAEWMKIEAPGLRIVSDELWAAAHARLDTTRKTYLRSTNGQLWGRPPSGLVSKYLLVGLGRCGHCGAGLEVRSRDHGGKKRTFFYSCSSYYRRGKSVCPNKIEIPMAAADAAVLGALLDEILTPDRLARVAERAVEVAKAEHQAPDVRAGIERQLAECETALGRLTAAVAAGGDVPALVQALQAQDGRRRELRRRLEALDAPPVKFNAELEQRLRAAVGEWREVLGRQVPQARQILAKLLGSKITFAPADRDGRRGFRFQATGSVEKLVAGTVPGFLQSVVSPRATDSNYKPPVFTDLENFLRRVDTFRRAEIVA